MNKSNKSYTFLGKRAIKYAIIVRQSIQRRDPMAMIRISEETLHTLKVRKAKFDDKSYDETIRNLLSK
jgi:hypothetical protein